MAENDQQSQDRTEQPTPKRLEEARKKGQIARSRELNMAFVMIAAAIGIFIFRPQLSSHLLTLLRDGLMIEPALLRHPEYMISAFGTAGVNTLIAFSPFLVLLLLASIGGGVAIGGWAFSTNPLEPKLSKLDPIKGIARVFGLRGLVEVAKALAKAFVVGGVALAFLNFTSTGIFKLSNAPLQVAMSDSGQMIATVFLICSLSLLLIALIDVPYQVWNHKRQLKMTRREVMDEMKETDGRPEVRSRIRQLQQELSGKRMLEAVAEADVVITNPAHFAVALKYDDGAMRAPVVIAKGADHMATKIREAARDHDVPLFEAPVVARAIYWTTEIDQEIPAALYLAVAHILTYIFGIRDALENGGDWPELPDIDSGEELRKLASGPDGKSTH